MSFPLTSQENARKRATLFETPDMLEDRIEQQRRGLFDETSIASQTSRRTCDFDKYKVASLRNAALNTFYDDQSHRAYTVSTPESRMDTGMMASRRSGRREHRQGDVTDWVSTSKDNSAKVGIQRELLFEKQTTAQGIPRKQDEQWCVRDKELDERDQSIRCQRPALKSVRDYSKGIHRTDSGSVVSKRTTSSRYRTDKRQMSVVYRQFGADSSVLQVECEEETPTLNSPNDVIIKVQASTVSLSDCLERRGFSFDIINPTHLPLTPGRDVVGHVVICGGNVTSVKEGDRVAALVKNGGNTRYISVPETSLVKVPRKVDSAEAAAMVSTYTVAYQALKLVSSQTESTFSLEGKKVLVIGGMNTVSQALIQMCLKARAEVFTTAPERRHAYIRNVLGAEPLPEDAKEWLPIVRKEIDLVFDGLCEDGLVTPSKALKAGGELVSFGHAAMLNEEGVGLFGAPISAHINNLWSRTMMNAKTLDIWESFERDPELFKKNLKSLFHLLKWDKIKPHIARRVGLSEVAASQSKLEQGDVRGIIVCTPWRRVVGAGCCSTVVADKEDDDMASVTTL